MAKLQNSYKCSKLLCISTISFILIVSIMVGLIISYHISIKNTFEMSISYNTDLIKNLSIIKTKSNKYTIITQDNLQKNIKDAQILNYKNFLEKYLEIQANWLNAWLTILAIIFGLLGIAIPICFTKFYENKKIEIEKYKVELNDLVNLVQQKNSQLVGLLSSTRNVNRHVTSLFKDLDDKKEKINELILETQQIQSNIRDENNFRQKNLDALFMRSKELQDEVDKEAIEIKKKSTEITCIFEQIKNYAEKAQKTKLDTEASSLLNMAAQFYQEYKYLDALSLINKALDIYRNPEYLSFRGLIYSKMKNYEKSIDDYKEALSIKGPDFSLFINLGVAYLQAGQISQAISILTRASELNPHHPITYYNLAEAYLRNTDYTSSLDALRTYISLEREPFILKDDKKIWEDALNLAPNDPDVKAIKELIRTKLVIKARKK